MNAGAERRREDLARLEGMCAVSGGRLLLVSRNGDPPIDITIDLVCRYGGVARLPCASRGANSCQDHVSSTLPFSGAGGSPDARHVPPQRVSIGPCVPRIHMVANRRPRPAGQADRTDHHVRSRLWSTPPRPPTAPPSGGTAEAVARTPSFPTDSLDFLSGTAARPKPQWRDIRTESLEPSSKMIQCEKCLQQLRVPDVPGIQVRCPRCLHIFRVAT